MERLSDQSAKHSGRDSEMSSSYLKKIKED